MILLEIVPNLRANFEEKTSRGGRPHKFTLSECQVILLEIVPNLRVNFEEKTSRGGRPHNLYSCEILTLKSLYIFLSANEDITL